MRRVRDDLKWDMLEGFAASLQMSKHSSRLVTSYIPEADVIAIFPTRPLLMSSFAQSPHGTSGCSLSFPLGLRLGCGLKKSGGSVEPEIRPIALNADCAVLGAANWRAESMVPITEAARGSSITEPVSAVRQGANKVLVSILSCL